MKRILLLLIAIICLFSCEKPPQEIPVSSVSLNQATAEMIVGETVQLSATVLPSNATEKTLSWASSKQSVAMVSGSGLVTALAEGSSTITVSVGGKSATCQVTVEKKTTPVTSITLNKTELSLIEGDEAILVATVKPDDATDKTVTWKSSDASIVSVSNDGKLSAIKNGTATITASAGDKSASCKVTVEKKVILVTSISLSKTELSLIEGDEETLAATVKPDDATDKTVKWESSDRSIASVNNEGKVSAIKEGTASITASSGNQSASCKVTVAKRVIAVESVALNKTEVELVEGESETLTATVKPDNATDKTVTWSSSDPGVVSVENGKITAIKAGNATISAKAGEKSGNCIVTVKQKPHVESLKIKDGSFSGLINKYYPISVTITPSDAQYDLEWIISDSRVAEVQGSGLSRNIYTKDFGKAEITVKDKISGKSASITVRTSVMDFEWKENTGSTYGGYPLVTIEEGEEYQLHYSCSPSSATHLFEDLSNLVFYEPTYAIEKPSIISIDPEGKVTGLKVGTVGIKPTGQIIKKSSGVERVYIKVKARTIAVTEVRLDKSSLTLNFGESAALTATVLPENATDKTVTWKSSDATVVSVTNDGKVSAIKAGNATITALAGNQSATCDITVVKPSSENIVFADQKVKEKLVTAFDQNKDGELSYEEAAAVTSIDGVFGAIKTYKSFDEFQYFTGVTTVPIGMFRDWNTLTSIILPESITRINKYAFMNCIGLKKVEIPASVTSLGYGAFKGCSSLTSMILPNSISGSMGYVTDTYTTDIKDYGVFSDCTSLETIVLSDNITSIGYGSFKNCTNLKSINLPKNLNVVSFSAFSNCINLKSISIPEGVTRIGNSAFSGCSGLNSVYLPQSLTVIDNYAFGDCSGISSIILPNRLLSIGVSAFGGCTGLTSITIPDSVSEIRRSAFRGCSNVTSIIIPESIPVINATVFADCSSLVSISIPESVTSIGGGAFSGCTSLNSISIPESVTYLGNYVFENCTSLKKLTIPRSVKRMDIAPFQYCKNLTITILAITPPDCNSPLFETDNCLVLVPASSLDAYRTASGWSDYADRIQAIPE